jgi:hypothetical protein
MDDGWEWQQPYLQNVRGTGHISKLLSAFGDTGLF